MQHRCGNPAFLSSPPPLLLQLDVPAPPGSVRLRVRVRPPDGVGGLRRVLLPVRVVPELPRGQLDPLPEGPGQLLVGDAGGGLAGLRLPVKRGRRQQTAVDTSKRQLVSKICSALF